MKTRALISEEKSRIIGMRDGGLRGAEIARQYRLPQSTVYTVFNNYDKRGTVESLKVPGRPPKLTERDNRSLKHIVMRNRRRPLTDIKDSMATNAGATTIRTALHEMGFHARVAAVKPFLRARHLAPRLAFAKAHKS